jgi:hypothetical protein
LSVTPKYGLSHIRSCWRYASRFFRPALADFYIIQNKSDKKCTVVEQKPADTKPMVVLGSKTYKTKTGAEKDLAVV